MLLLRHGCHLMWPMLPDAVRPQPHRPFPADKEVPQSVFHFSKQGDTFVLVIADKVHG
jgi:hypothetical protein